MISQSYHHTSRGVTLSRSSPDIGCEQVIALIAREKSVPLRQLIHPQRSRARAARARQMAMYLSHVVLGRTLEEVGEAFGRDRTTVSYACALIEDLRDDPRVDAELDRLERLIGEGRDDGR